MTFDLDAYLARLKIDAPPVTSAGLARLQEAHLCSIAFEAIDPLTGRVPALDPDGLHHKLVSGGRGGYCFEQNSLFALALAALGFEAAPVMARVRNGASRGGARTHLAHIVRLEGREWLADVGFGGGGSRWPVPVERHRLDYQPGEVYRVVQDAETGEIVLERLVEGAWSGLYGFERLKVEPVDVEAANHLCATWEKAPFSSNLMLHRLRPDGRIGVFNTKVNEVRDGVKTSREIGSEADLRRLLADAFGLLVGEEDLALIAARLGLPADETAQAVA
ncbi:arylamine N-acetyltransferase [Breoghania sp.]|uniref:arylamine N-acetyltransferase family protein n=1 Tax=Breoghania sp. TaxID=2065378 RepID=UPI002AA6D6F2|nr:arylamine N-acetyltransferase [Breoghania sp.]